MAARNKFFEVFVLVLLTLGITTIGILYVRERSKSSFGTRANGDTSPQNFRENSSAGSAESPDIISRLRHMYLSGYRTARPDNMRIHSDRPVNVHHQENQRDDFIIPSGAEKDEYLFRKAVLMYKHLRYDDVIKTVDELQLNYPQSKFRIRARCYQGLAFLKKGRNVWGRDYLNAAKDILVEAINHYIRNRQFEPRTITEFVIAMGEASRSLGGFGPDIEYLLKRSSVGAPAAHKSEIYVQLGYVALFRNNYNEAMLFFLKSNSELARIGMARVYIRMSKQDQAFRIYDEFITYNRDSEYYNDVKKAYIKQALFWGKRAYGEGNSLLAYKILSRLIQHFPDLKEYEECNYMIAESLYKKRVLNYALKYFKRISVNFQSPYYDIALYRIGQIYYESNNANEALSAFDRLISTRPDTRYRSDVDRYRSQIQAASGTGTVQPQTRQNTPVPDNRNTVNNEDESQNQTENQAQDRQSSNSITPPVPNRPVTPPGIEDRERELLRGMN